jgi:methylphosphotriester-DNA--protein-cysteine methyltransferase
MAHRSQRVREELSKNNSVTEAIYGAGYHSNGRFYAKSTETQIGEICAICVLSPRLFWHRR